MVRNARGNPELVVVGGSYDRSTEVLSFCDWTFRLGARGPLDFADGGLVPDGSSAFYIFTGGLRGETPVREVYHYDHRKEVFTTLKRKKGVKRIHECVLALDEI